MLVVFGVRAAARGIHVGRAHVRVGKRIGELTHAAGQDAIGGFARFRRISMSLSRQFASPDAARFSRVEPGGAVLAVNLHSRRDVQIGGKCLFERKADRAGGRLRRKPRHAHKFPQHIQHGGLSVAHEVLFGGLLNAYADKMFPIGNQVDDQSFGLRRVQRAPGQFFVFTDAGLQHGLLIRLDEPRFGKLLHRRTSVTPPSPRPGSDQAMRITACPPLCSFPWLTVTLSTLTRGSQTRADRTSRTICGLAASSGRSR